MASTRLRLEPADPELASAVRELIGRVGIRQAAMTLGMGGAAATNIAAMLPVQRGTLALAREWSGLARVEPPLYELTARGVHLVTSGESAPSTRKDDGLRFDRAPRRAPVEVLPEITPDPEGASKALQFGIRNCGIWTQPIPWRITIGPRNAQGDWPIVVDFTGCARVWGCGESHAESASSLLGYVNDEILCDSRCWTTEFPDAPFTRLAKFAAKIITQTHEAMTGSQAAEKPPEVLPEILAMQERELEAEERRAQLERSRVEFNQMASSLAETEARLNRTLAEVQAAEAAAIALPPPPPRKAPTDEEDEAERAALIAQVAAGEKPRRRARKL